MDTDFYVTLFSNSSQKFYPNNSLSKFTARLPKPLNFFKSYKVGLVEIQCPKIIGVVTNNNTNVDEIVLPTIKKIVPDINLKDFTQFMIECSKFAELYDDKYFQDFLDVKKLNDFENKFKKYKPVENPNSQQKFGVIPILMGEGAKFRAGISKAVTYEGNKKYTGKQLLYLYLAWYCKNYEKMGNDDILGDHHILRSDNAKGAMLYNVILQFMSHLRMAFQDHRTFHMKDSSYMLCYTDIIEPRICGNDIAKVLFIGTRRPSDILDEIFVKNIQYLVVAKNYIEEISILLCDEMGRQIIFESGYKPCSVTLHFKPLM